MNQPFDLRFPVGYQLMLQLVWGLCVVCFCGRLVVSGQSTVPASSGQFLKAHQVEEKQMRGGETHPYPLELPVGHYLKLVVEQKGIDVEVVLAGPDGVVVCQVDGPNGTRARNICPG